MAAPPAPPRPTETSGLRAGAAALLRVGPHAGAHRVALRAGVSVGVPLLVLTLTGHVSWAIYGAFGAFASVYGRDQARPERAGMQLQAGLVLTACLVLGSAVALLPGERWWMVVVGSVVAAGGTLLADALRWHPPGPLFMVFGFAAAATVPGRPHLVAVAAVVGLASAAFAVLVGSFRPWHGMAAPRLPRPDFAAALHRPGARAHLLRYLVAPLIAGGSATALGWGHPYWAMVGAVVPMAAPDALGRVVRATQRMIGTVIGLAVAAILLWGQPHGVVAVLLVALLQTAVELLIGRNYAAALVFVTPLALLMGQLARPLPVDVLLRDRAVETALGVAVAIAATLATRDRLSGLGRAGQPS